MGKTNSTKKRNQNTRQKLEQELKQLLATEMSKKPKEIDWDKIEQKANIFVKESHCKYAYQVLFFVVAHRANKNDVDDLITIAHRILESDRTDIPSLMFLLKQSPDGVSQEITMNAINKLSVKLREHPNNRMIKRCLELLLKKNDPDISQEALKQEIQRIINTGHKETTEQERPSCLSKLIDDVNAALKPGNKVKDVAAIIEKFKKQQPNLAGDPVITDLEIKVINYFLERGK